MPSIEIALGLALIALALAAAALMLGYYARTGVVPLSSSAGEIADVIALLRKAGVPAQARIFELGCGWGRLAMALAREFPEATITAVELSPIPWAFARLRARRSKNLRVVRADFLGLDLSGADAVTCYLMRRPMARLASRLDAQLRPGTPVVALTFWFRGRTPAATLQRTGGVRGAAALYRWPARGSSAGGSESGGGVPSA
jgi:hypothetical protein